jgi:hypothetical protein
MKQRHCGWRAVDLRLIAAMTVRPIGRTSVTPFAQIRVVMPRLAHPFADIAQSGAERLPSTSPLADSAARSQCPKTLPSLIEQLTDPISIEETCLLSANLFRRRKNSWRRLRDSRLESKPRQSLRLSLSTLHQLLKTAQRATPEKCRSRSPGQAPVPGTSIPTMHRLGCRQWKV